VDVDVPLSRDGILSRWRSVIRGFGDVAGDAPTGALMTFIALWTGALWGRPTWGTYWARMRMTELILLFLYLGVIACATRSTTRGAPIAPALCCRSEQSTPIIYYWSDGGTHCTRARRCALKNEDGDGCSSECHHVVRGVVL
jgi:hypothetical protein